jgi:hypothetical protein
MFRRRSGLWSTFHVQVEINKAGLPIWRRKALQGPDGMDDEATRIVLTHLIVQGIYYLQILGSKLVVLREGDISGLASSTAISAGSHVRHYRFSTKFLYRTGLF